MDTEPNENEVMRLYVTPEWSEIMGNYFSVNLFNEDKLIYYEMAEDDFDAMARASEIREVLGPWVTIVCEKGVATCD